MTIYLQPAPAARYGGLGRRAERHRGIARPYLSRAADRPLITHGVQSGDVSANSAMVWARADRPSRMLVEVCDHRQLQDHPWRRVRRCAAGERFHRQGAVEGAAGGAGHLLSRPLCRICRRRRSSASRLIGRFRTAPADRRSVSFVWSGDTAGQGWGIDEARGGMRTLRDDARNRPDFFIHSGDTIYADAPIARRGEAAGRHAVEESRHRGEVEARRDARGVSRQLQIQPAGPQSAAPSTPRFRCSRNGTTTRSPTTGGRRRPDRRRSTGACDTRQQRVVAGGARAAAPSTNTCRSRPTPAEPGRVYRKISYGPLLDVFMLDMRSYRGPNGEGREETYGPAAHFLGPEQVAWLKRELQALTRDLEGDRGRSADRPDRLRGLRPPMGRRGGRAGHGRAAARPRA